MYNTVLSLLKMALPSVEKYGLAGLTLIVLKLSQPLKQRIPIVCKDSGSSIFERDSQPENALFPKLSSALGSCNDLRLVQAPKARLPMFCNEFGNETCLSAVQLLNILSLT